MKGAQEAWEARLPGEESCKPAEEGAVVDLDVGQVGCG
jgi:hypothetical protein